MRLRFKRDAMDTSQAIRTDKEDPVQGRKRTREQLYREAKRLGIKGRSKMNKGQLKAAVDRRH
jgi:hypothetical protein